MADAQFRSVSRRLSATLAVAGCSIWLAVPGFAGAGPTIDELRGGNGKSAVVVFNVGQGSCALLSCPNGNKVLLDCGSSSKGPVDKAKALFTNIVNGKNLEAVLISHPDKDHIKEVIAFLSALGDGVRIGSVLLGGDPSKWATRGKKFNYKAVKDYLAVRTKNLKVFDKAYHDEPLVPNKDVSCGTPGRSGDGIYILVVHAMDGNEDDNGNSLVAMFRQAVWGIWAYRVLFGGDAEWVTEAAILRNYPEPLNYLLRTSVMVAAHHGGNGTAKSDWVRATQPYAVFYSAGYRKKYYHPRCIIVDAYQNDQWNERLGSAGVHQLTCGKAKTGWETRSTYPRSQFSTWDSGALIATFDGLWTTKIYTCKNNELTDCKSTSVVADDDNH
jgi:beta-lactamase superfamily II metal-dependent hydrolase